MQSNDYKIEHFEGRPQGPSLSFASSSSLALLVSAPGNDGWFIPLPPSWARFVGSLSQKLTLLIAVPKLSPWMVASSSSKALGWRDPSAAYNMVSRSSTRGWGRATHGESPSTPRRASPIKRLASQQCSISIKLKCGSWFAVPGDVLTWEFAIRWLFLPDF